MSSIVVDRAAADLNLRVSLKPLSGPALVRDYYAGAPALAPFFPGFPWDTSAWTRTANQVRNYFSPDKLRPVTNAIQTGNADARAKLQRIADGDGFFVQTGQQAGLFGGPLFTVYKILTAIRLAASVEKQLGVTVAPLFWIAADDHDFAEVNHAYLLTGENTLEKLELRDDGRPAASMQRRVLGQEIESIVQQLQTWMPATEFAGELAALLKQAYTPGNNVAGAFRTLVSFLFDRFGLMITSSADHTVKRLGAPLMQYELAHAEAHEDAVNGQTQKLVNRGYHEQVPVRSDAANVSYEDANGRDRLMRWGNDWELSRSKQRFSGDEIAELLELEPERFSANVLLRPVIASAVFPTLAYVGGPAEISYFAQIGCLFAAHRVPMPLVVPRASVEIVEYKVQKVLDKFALTADDVHVPFDRLATDIVRRDVPAEITATIEKLREDLGSGYARLIDEAVEIDPTLQGPLESARNAGHKMLNDMDKKILKHLKKRASVELEQLRRASTNLYPLGKSQERVLSLLTYYARYGPDFIDAIANEIHFDFNETRADWSGVACG
jgi:bacillithiol biosynthesis cysteine-adding enzyme BshC